MPPARCTSSMCHLPAGQTLQICGTLSATALIRLERIVHTGFIRQGQRVQNGVGGAAHRHIQRKGIVDRIGGDDIARLDICSRPAP